MSSSLSRQSLSAENTECAVPFRDYAQTLRQLFPSVRTIGFYDQFSCAQWTNEIADNPDLATQVSKVLLQASAAIRDSSTVKIGNRITHVTVIRAPDNSIKGAMALVLRHRRYGRKVANLRPHDLEAALAPITRIIGLTWDAAATDFVPSDAPPQPEIITRGQRDPFVGAAARATSAPVLLRRALSNAVNGSPCAFGGLIAAERQFTMVQRGTDSQVQSEMRHIADALRQPMAEVLRSRTEPLLIASPGTSIAAAIHYKLVACPVRNSAGQLVAMLVLLRGHHERDFDSATSALLQNITTRIPSHVLDELAPFSQKRITAKIAKAPKDAHIKQPIIAVNAPAAPAEPTMEQRLRTALREDGFDLHAQSITPLRQESETARYEVLLRLRQENSLQLPDTFLHAAETGGLLPEIDRWVIGRVFKAVRPHIDALQDGRWEFALNVSAASLQRKSFGDFIETQLFRSPIPAKALMFEFSEHDVLAHRPMFEALAPRLASLGCRIALDNCRQGLDIFLSIADLPVHRLKIDAALTHHLTSDSRAARAVRELVEVASDIGVETVGEHVEDEATCDMLRELGIDFAQGFKVAHPEPLMRLLS